MNHKIDYLKSVVLSVVLLTYIQSTLSEITFDEVKKYSVSSSEFGDIKRSEVGYNLNNAYAFLVGNQKSSYNTDNQFIQEVNETWHLAFEAEEAFQNERTSYSAANIGVTSAFFPFLVCVSSDDKSSGYQRMQSLSERFMDISKEFVSASDVNKWSDFGMSGKNTAGTNSPVYPMYNTIDRSCFGFNSLATEAKETAAYSSADKSADDFFVIPFTFSMKMGKIKTLHH